MQDNNRRMNFRQNRKKKLNKILNILIGIVLLLIIVVVVNIVTDDKTEETAGEQTVSDITELEEDTTVVKPEEQQEESSTNESTTQNESNTTSSSEQEDATTDTTENTSGATTTEQSSSNSNDVNATVDPSWEPIGTTQTGEHVSSYDKSSVDWAEKVEALAYGAGLDSSNMYVKFLGNGGSPQKSIGTVTSKDGKEIYRIHLEWVDGQGWKPTKREKLTTLKDAS
ncbi:YrrS family protein [Psychrobacillus sp. NPDC096426]|uniref:YrrS family protein n=1 Tax=Psychrobacillus sp. NPDC096426 TaxID=3364491 RepID=UPI00381B2A17